MGENSPNMVTLITIVKSVLKPGFKQERTAFATFIVCGIHK
jgi:hypothetical protein